jgi:hypothetical protein
MASPLPIAREKLLGEKRYVEFCDIVLTEIRKPIREHKLVWEYRMRDEFYRISKGCTLEYLMKLIPMARRMDLEMFARMMWKGRGF